MHILIVDDFEPWRNHIRSFLEQRPGFKIVGEAADGIEGVEKAAELQPDLILLDIGMPRLNGLEAAERIRKVSPRSKLLFVSVEKSAEVVEAALSVGAQAYIWKEEIASKLLPAIDALGLEE